MDIAFAMYVKSCNGVVHGPDRCDWLVDVSQDASRKPWSRVFRSLHKGSEIFCMCKDRLALPQEHLRMLGLPCCTTDHLTGSVVRELAGEGMGAPCIGVCMISLFVSLQDSSLWSLPVSSSV